MTISIPGSKIATQNISAANNSSGGAAELKFIYGDDVYQPLSNTSLAFVLLENHLKSLPSTAGLKIADFGAGTGQFAALTKKLFADTDVHAYEIDANAEKYQDANKELHNVEFTSHITNVSAISDSEEFDAIISSPPYIPEIAKTMAAFSGAALLGPASTVYGGFKGLEVSQLFIEKAGKTLKSGGILVSVHSAMQSADISELLEANDFENISLVSKDSLVVGAVPSEIDLVSIAYTVAYKK